MPAVAASAPGRSGDPPADQRGHHHVRPWRRLRKGEDIGESRAVHVAMDVHNLPLHFRQERARRRRRQGIDSSPKIASRWPIVAHAGQNRHSRMLKAGAITSMVGSSGSRRRSETARTPPGPHNPHLVALQWVRRPSLPSPRPARRRLPPGRRRRAPQRGCDHTCGIDAAQPDHDGHRRRQQAQHAGQAAEKALEPRARWPRPR